MFKSSPNSTQKMLNKTLSDWAFIDLMMCVWWSLERAATQNQYLLICDTLLSFRKTHWAVTLLMWWTAKSWIEFTYNVLVQILFLCNLLINLYSLSCFTSDILASTTVTQETTDIGNVLVWSVQFFSAHFCRQCRN